MPIKVLLLVHALKKHGGIEHKLEAPRYDPMTQNPDFFNSPSVPETPKYCTGQAQFSGGVDIYIDFMMSHTPYIRDHEL